MADDGSEGPAALAGASSSATTDDTSGPQLSQRDMLQYTAIPAPEAATAEARQIAEKNLSAGSAFSVVNVFERVASLHHPSFCLLGCLSGRHVVFGASV